MKQFYFDRLSIRLVKAKVKFPSVTLRLFEMAETKIKYQDAITQSLQSPRGVVQIMDTQKEGWSSPKTMAYRWAPSPDQEATTLVEKCTETSEPTCRTAHGPFDSRYWNIFFVNLFVWLIEEFLFLIFSLLFPLFFHIGSTPSISRTVSNLGEHSKLSLRLRYWMIDSWENGEKAGVSIEGIEVWSHTNYARESCDNLWNHGFYEPWSGSGGRVCYYDVDVTVDHTGPSATIAMYATINGQSKCTLSLSVCGHAFRCCVFEFTTTRVSSDHNSYTFCFFVL